MTPFPRWSPSRAVLAPGLAAGLLALGLLAGCSGSTPSSGSSPGIPTDQASGPPSSGSTGASSSADGSSTPGGTVTSASPSSPASSSPGAARCGLSALTVGLRQDPGGGGAGSVIVLLTFKNRSSKPCSLNGYPGVSFVGHGNGTQLGVPAARDTSNPPQVVTLKAGKTTTAALKVANVGNYDTAQCQPATADGLRVYPPGSTTSAYVAYKAQACTRNPGEAKQLTVSPVGTSG